MLKRKCEQISFEVEVGKMKTQTDFVLFFKDLFLKSAIAPILELYKVTKKNYYVPILELEPSY